MRRKKTRTEKVMIWCTAVMAGVMIIASCVLFDTEYWRQAVGFMIFGALWLTGFFYANGWMFLRWYLRLGKKKGPSARTDKAKGANTRKLDTEIVTQIFGSGKEQKCLHQESTSNTQGSRQGLHSA